MRAFIGCPLTDRDRARLGTWRDLHLDPGWRPVPLPDLHLTLCFLGAQSAPALETLADRLRELDRLPGSRARGVVVQPFPAPEARLLALELAPDPALLDLHLAVAALATGLGLNCAERAFRPHVTLARGQGGRRAWPLAIELCFEQLCVFGSTDTPAGVAHPVLCRVPLDAAGTARR